MPQEFTFDDFVRFCQENPNICKNPKDMIAKYKRNKLITETDDGKFIIKDEVCEKYGIE